VKSIPESSTIARCLAAAGAALLLGGCATLTVPDDPAGHGPSATRPQMLAARTERIGDRFLSAYAGEAIGPGGVVRVYVTRAGARRVEYALRDALGPSRTAGYRVIVVHHSGAALERTTLRIARARLPGIELVEWGPDPASQTVLAHVRGNPVAAAERLHAAFRGWVTVARWHGGLPVPVAATRGRPLGVTATLINEAAAVLAQMPLEGGALHEAI
jgi:hypothetical protein